MQYFQIQDSQKIASQFAQQLNGQDQSVSNLAQTGQIVSSQQLLLYFQLLKIYQHRLATDALQIKKNHLNQIFLNKKRGNRHGNEI
ncbi:MAG: hypothetical protein GWN00_17830 [Aliifodinibius sp.]|nr:hypothetical protein [Fodinibius sp.]NIV12920.1 hypothetical protein [Fodinibius sp.]NIY26594.1 hypothetical protein [Fodinibius sp.]